MAEDSPVQEVQSEEEIAPTQLVHGDLSGWHADDVALCTSSVPVRQILEDHNSQGRPGSTRMHKMHEVATGNVWQRNTWRRK
eukprot:336063-Prorocentrum_lima.AAC.1